MYKHFSFCFNPVEETRFDSGSKVLHFNSIVVKPPVSDVYTFSFGMTQLSQGHFNYGYSAALNSDILEIPYKNQAYNLLVMLPRTMYGIYNLESAVKMSGLNIKTIRSQLTYQQVSVAIPKFTMSLNIELSSVISKVSLLSYASFKTLSFSYYHYIIKITDGRQ